MHPNFVKPRYDAGGFAHLPQRIQDIFKKKEYETVIFFFIDGFGWRFYEQFKEHPFFVELSKRGSVKKLTSQFPSTTAAHVTAWHTGQTVGESGVFEWQYYEPKLDALFAPLLFSFAGTTERDTAQASGIPPGDLYPTQTIYPALAKLKVEAHIFQHSAFTPSASSDTVMQGANVHAYKTLSEALVNIRILLDEPSGSRYIGYYFGDVDSILHKYGPVSPQAQAEIETLLDTLLRQFLLPLSQHPHGKTLFLLTADHGHVEVDPATCTYLNREPRFAGVEDFFKRDQAGDALVPAGSARDMFLYIKDDLLDEAQVFLASRLTGIADVVTTQALIEAGYFGPVISETFLSRIGNLIILPYRYQSVWWYMEDKFEQIHYGHHGGLTPQEMEIPLITCIF
ncbi:MAG: alkaline phosphatase family protein [Anaerolineales bacterium]|nr:alkaline phosphatase family protein [Anaerolineales bacterium]